ncbi:abscission/NoCut checkpoint regulator isoform X2 [Pteropus vampyrus]|uniref:Abscission/NoCut checkpoint regulator isoform X2 n=1 Tax=Pteropus vampyrus TaxID=132908 RepID=A0A6P3PX79_PTEVA|nr:abscission/NoCut checkpoint regulator isoform X2 [Pteropus vampyrus]XP_023383525.1 abscission/NoCut checkpoint regulator isoform X2 [Pteropus vampyrus]
MLNAELNAWHTNGCKNCGRAFCSSCLSFSAVVPRAGNTQQKVCKQCYEVLTRGSSPANASKWSPPQNYKKRMAALEAKQKPSTLQNQGLTHPDQIIAERLARLRQQNKPKLVPSQAEIEARLAALRDEPQGSIPSTQDMEARLAALQGRAPPSQTPKPVHQPPDTRTQAQQAQDLLTQLTAEVAIDESWERGGPGNFPIWDPRDLSPFSPGGRGYAAHSLEAASIQNDLNQGGPGSHSTNSKGQATSSLEEEKTRLLAEAAVELREENTRQEKILALAKRLAVLRGQDPDRVTLQDCHLPDSDDDEETAIQRVLQQLTEEAALDEASGFNIPAEPTLQPQAQCCRAEPEVQALAPRPDAEEEELPWCCICNEDATLRCAGCDGDLYCVRCFREGHDAFELKEHRTSAYCPPHADQEH